MRAFAPGVRSPFRDLLESRGVRRRRSIATTRSIVRAARASLRSNAIHRAVLIVGHEEAPLRADGDPGRTSDAFEAIGGLVSTHEVGPLFRRIVPVDGDLRRVAVH